jgi:hypothetical protein
MPHKTYGPSRVPIDDCVYVDDFTDDIKKKGQLAIPEHTPITVYKPDGVSPYLSTDKVEVLGTDGEVCNAPLVAKADPTWLHSRRKYLDALAKAICELYEFRVRFKGSTTIGDVLAAKDGVEGKAWFIRKAALTSSVVDADGFTVTIRRRQRRTKIKLPNLYTPDEWRSMHGYTMQNSPRYPMRKLTSSSRKMSTTREWLHSFKTLESKLQFPPEMMVQLSRMKFIRY